MTDFITLRKLAIGVPLALIACLMAMVLIFPGLVSAYDVQGKRISNDVVWDSVFQDNVAKYNFPRATRDHIRQGMYQWDSNNTGADFDVSEGTGSDAYVQAIKFSRYNYPDRPGRTTHLYSSGKIRFSAIHLNRDWNWSDTSCTVNEATETADVRIIITHEAGHLINLGHDRFHKEAVMWPDGKCKLRTVADDDAGVVANYGYR